MKQRAWWVSVAWVGVVLAIPRPAAACGGFFCSNVTQPIDQSGEQILFSVDRDGSVTAVVQISYSGPAESFAWIVPVPSIPTLSVGSAVLFQELARVTKPVFTIDRYPVEGTCAVPHCHYPSGASYSGGGCGSIGTGVAPPRRAIEDAAVARDATLAPSDGSVSVVDSRAVGPYETVTLTGTDTPAIQAWLTEHGYLFPNNAIAALEPYVAAGHAFVVLRLRKQQTVGDLEPLAMHYAAGEPCIPIRLTAIAATSDMPVTAYFLTEADVAPAGSYVLTEVAEDTMQWVGSGNWYDFMLSTAVDDAGGHAFVKEYAGPVPTMQLSPAPQSVLDLASEQDARRFVQQLSLRGVAGSPDLLMLLTRYLPPPAGVSAQDFFNCLARSGCTDYARYLGSVSFDATGLAGAIEDLLVRPLREARALLSSHTRLTRLSTTLSPSEMTEDPTFRLVPPTRDISNVHNAKLTFECGPTYLMSEAPLALTMPSGRRVRYREGTPYVGDETYCRRLGLLPGDGTHAATRTRFRATSYASPLPIVWALASSLVALRGARRRRR